MGNVFRIFARDVRRLFKAPAALIVVLVLLVLPSLYTWYNVVGFWDPYGNTDHLRVCVVNEDEGGSSDMTGSLDVGELIVDNLRENDDLDWTFVSRDEAILLVERGQAYAAFIIPSDFTQHLLSLSTGSYEAPAVTYVVNEKAGPVAPKITDVGATTLDETINATFVKTVSDVAVQAVDTALTNMREDSISTANTTVSRIDKTLAGLASARTTLATMQRTLDESGGQIEDAQAVLPAAKEDLTQAIELANSLSEAIGVLEKEMTQFSQDAWPLVSQALADAQDSSSKIKQTTTTLQGALTTANANVKAAVGRGQAALGEARAVINTLRQAAELLPEGTGKDALLSAAGALSDECNILEEQLATAAEIAQRADSAAATAERAAAAADTSLQEANTSLQSAINTFFGTALPSMSAALLSASSALSSVAAAASTERALIDQIDTIMGQLHDVSRQASQAVSHTDEFIAEVEGGLEELKRDIAAVLGADDLTKFAEGNNLNAQEIAEFMESPTRVVTEELYPLNAYGAAMAPLFMNLTFWIGAFMLMVIMRQEVDGEGIRRLTLWQRYLGRFLLFACLAVLQALICVAGVVAIGVETVSVVALASAAVVASLAYLSIIYALSLTLQHVGKGICILLVFAQIPAATGIYPIEMTSSFFQAIYPFLPFTYGIEAMREAICGFYGTYYARDLAVLGAFFVGALALGLGVRPLISNVNRMVAAQVEESDIFNVEQVEAPARPFRLSQLVQVLTDKEEYRAQLEERYLRFEQLRPRLIRVTIALSVAVPVVLMVVFALTPAEKAVILTIWLVWLVVALVALLVMENMRTSLRRQLNIGDLSGEGLAKLVTTASAKAVKLVATASSQARTRRPASKNAQADSPQADSQQAQRSNSDADASGGERDA